MLKPVCYVTCFIISAKQKCGANSCYICNRINGIDTCSCPSGYQPDSTGIQCQGKLIYIYYTGKIESEYFFKKFVCWKSWIS
jgi:hypothetical protein